MKPITYLDLFSGAGGFAKGFLNAGMPIGEHYYSEINTHAIANYRYNFKNAHHVGSVTDVRGADLPHRPNIISFGFPCQDLSVAGNGAGLDGARSGLFYQALRLVSECKPEIFAFENVQGLLHHAGWRTFQKVLGEIAKLRLYECQWQCLDTSWVLPQHRERVYLVGHLRGRGVPRIFPFRRSDQRAAQGAAKAPVTHTITAGGHSGGHHSGVTIIQEPSVRRIGSTSNQISQGYRAYDPSGLSPALTTGQGGPSGASVIIREQKIKIAGRLNSSQDGVIVDPSGIAQTVTAGHGNTPKIVQRGRGKNNGGEHDISPAITSESWTQNHAVKEGDIYRRLTEIECERLQGFPDDWTKYGDYDGTIKQIAKTNRYALMGNAVSVPFPEHIGRALLETPNLFDH